MSTCRHFTHQWLSEMRGTPGRVRGPRRSLSPPQQLTGDYSGLADRATPSGNPLVLLVQNRGAGHAIRHRKGQAGDRFEETDIGIALDLLQVENPTWPHAYTPTAAGGSYIAIV